MTTAPFPRSEAQTDDPTDVIAIEFDDDLLAQEAVLATTRLAKRGSVSMDDAVLVRKDDRGRVRFGQTREVDPRQAAISGGMWGGLIGLFAASTTGWLLGIAVGALAAWWWASRRDVGVPNAWLHQVADRMPNGRTAAVFLLPAVFPTHLIAELGRFRGRLLYSDLDGVDPEAVEEALAV